MPHVAGIDELSNQKRKGIFLFGVPRGGTNLFCALLHNHPQIISLTQKGTKEFLASLNEKQGKVLQGAVCTSREHLIYQKGGFRKQFTDVTHIAYDKVHYDRSKGWAYWELARKLIDNDLFYGLVVLRHPFATLSSMHRFHEKYYRERWKFNLENTAEFYQRFFRAQILLLREGGVHGIAFEQFLQNIEFGYSELCNFLGIHFEPYMTSFKQTFIRMGTPSRGQFEEQESGGYSGGNLEKRGIRFSPQKMYFDPSSGEHTLGRGGFNPLQPLDLERILQGLQNPNPEHVRLFRRVFGRGIAASDLNYLLRTPVPTIERLREMDVKDLDGYYKRVSFLPKYFRGIRTRVGRIVKKLP